MQRAPGFDAIAATRARFHANEPAIEQLRSVQIALSNALVLEHHAAMLSRLEDTIPGEEVIAAVVRTWPAMAELSAIGPRPADTYPQALARRKMQLQSAQDYLAPLAREAGSAQHELHHLFEHQREALRAPEHAALLTELVEREDARVRLMDRRSHASAIRMNLAPTKEILATFADLVAVACAELDGNLHDGIALAKALSMAVTAVESLSAVLEDARLSLPLPAPPSMGDDPSESAPSEVQAEVKRVLASLGELRRTVDAEIRSAEQRIAELDQELAVADAALREITG